MYLVQFLFSFLERIAFFNCARHSVSGQLSLHSPLCRVPACASIAYGNRFAALPIGARLDGQEPCFTAKYFPWFCGKKYEKTTENIVFFVVLYPLPLRKMHSVICS